jgi:hypothetical protein
MFSQPIVGQIVLRVEVLTISVGDLIAEVMVAAA